jgi:uncharacterized membrane protein YfcA
MLLVYLCVGLAAGVLSGMVGIGGGISAKTAPGVKAGSA